MMRSSVLVFICSFYTCLGIGQLHFSEFQQSNKGKLFLYWGWNRERYTKSNLSFRGEHYDFKLYKVIAHDRQSPFNLHLYFNPKVITIPQYNFRVGYFFSKHLSISLGIDHMKYVVDSAQYVKIKGNISESGTRYDGIYNNEKIKIQRGFLRLEHTDGLNYVNIECRRMATFYHHRHLDINHLQGFGTGILIPRTDTELLNNKRHDEFHISGYGIGAMGGIQLNYFKYFFVQSEFKTGFIHLPDILTTESDKDKASQHFFYGQINIVFGINICL